MAVQQAHSGDPFAINSLLTFPELDDEAHPAWLLSPFDKTLQNNVFHLAETEKTHLRGLEADFFHLDLHDVPLPYLDSSSASTIGTEIDADHERSKDIGKEPEQDEDVWALPNVVNRRKSINLVSWDHFLKEDHVEAPTAYLSEAGAGFFGLKLNAISHKSRGSPLKNARLDLFLSSLREMGLGWDSAFFHYENEQKKFILDEELFTIRGVSVDITSSVISDFTRIGQDTRVLQDFMESANRGAKAPQIRIALAAAVRMILYALNNIIQDSRQAVSSLLQLQQLFEKPAILLNCLRSLVESTNKQSSSSDILSSLLLISENQSNENPWLAGVLQETTTRTAAPYIREKGNSVGLGNCITFGPSADISASEDMENAPKASELVTDEVDGLLTESHQNLTLLKDNCPGHVLLTGSTQSHPVLRWEYSWEGIVSLQSRAAEYEANLKSAITSSREAISGSAIDRVLDVGDTAVPEDEAKFESQQNIFSDLEADSRSRRALGTDRYEPQDKLYQSVSAALLDADNLLLSFQPPLDQSLSLSLQPLLGAQHDLLSYSVLALLFETHNLGAHLTIQSRFQLLGDGLFASRLSIALFDASLASGEGRRKAGAPKGLRLQSRDTWPPASSELRLVLMDILSESFVRQNRHNSNSDISESLSFAIRDLSDDELENCRDVDSIHALDFLALQYRAPRPMLEAVITPKSLKTYDRIFIQLLRLLRIKSVAQSFIRDVANRGRVIANPRNKDHRYRMEMQHFVLTFADWSQNTVIGGKWARFEASIVKVEECINKRDYEGTLEACKGLGYLRSLHEDLLDDIARTLFLKKRQVDVKAVLDDIFGIILGFAKHVRELENSEDRKTDDATIERLYDDFRRQVRRFLRYLNSNSIESQTRQEADGDALLLSQLALRLDMVGYYAV